MTKKHEELVEEIRLVWCKDCADGPQSYETYEPEWDGICANDAEELCRERAGKCITLILSAVEDGEIRLRRLPPLGTLPWEVERKSWLHYKYVFRGQTEWLRSLPEGNLILIAFLPEEIEPLGRSL